MRGSSRKEKKGIEEDVNYFLSGVLRGCLTVASERFECLLFQVLCRIWPEVEDREDEILSIIFADGSSLYPVCFPFPEEQPKKRWIIFFPDSLFDEKDETIRFVIAHEFAHFVLGHKSHAEKEEHEKSEKAASDLAARWGFPKAKDRG